MVVLSEYWREVLSERVSDEKMVILPNAVDPDEYDPEYGARPPHVAFVSNHLERKGIRELTSALDDLFAEGLDFRATIAGSGPLSGLAEDLDAERERVSYVGYVSEAEKRDLLSRASIYALPTYAEGLPIGLLEGMAGGNAVVTTRVAAIPDVVEPESGELIDPGDEDALRAALRRLVEDPEAVAEGGRRNRELIESTYSWRRTAERLATLYEDLREGGESRSEAGRPGARIDDPRADDGGSPSSDAVATN